MELPEETIAELLALGGVALAHDQLDDALAAICRIAARAVAHADGASLTTFSTTGPEAAATSGGWAEQLDELQHAEHEGPCLDAGRTGILFRVRDLEHEQRWPSYAPRALRAGARSIVSIPMMVEAKAIGALNVYARTADAFGAEEVAIAEVIAGHASLATQVATAFQGHHDLAAQLRAAMSSRATIEQAKGMVMAADPDLDADGAFEVLRAASQRENVKLREIAQRMTERRDRVGGTRPGRDAVSGSGADGEARPW